MGRDKDIKAQHEELYGITDEGDIVSLTDLEMREEVLPASHEENPKDDSCSLCGQLIRLYTDSVAAGIGSMPTDPILPQKRGKDSYGW